MGRVRSGYAVKRLSRDYVVAGKIAELLGLDVFWVDMRLPMTDIDVVGYNSYTDELHVVEVKTRLYEGNVQRAINQLWFRSTMGDRVWIAVPTRDTYYALALIPNMYGVIQVSSRKAEIMRESRKFSGVYRGMLRMKLLGMMGAHGK